MRSHLHRCRAWFRDYTAGFLTGDPDRDLPVRLKIEHTGRVEANMDLLAAALDMPSGDRALAGIMGRLHDVGRFRQLAEYGTFRDAVSVNHAHLGLRELTRHRVLHPLPRDRRREVAAAVVFHNALRLPPHADGRRGLFMRMLRDADKLDIWRVVEECYRQGPPAEGDTVTMNLPDTPGASEAVLARLAAGRLALLEDIRNLNDFKLLQIAWVYDLNLPATYRILRERGHLEGIAATLHRTPAADAAVARALAFLARRGSGQEASGRL